MSVRLAPLPADRFDAWRAATRERLIAVLRESGRRPGADAPAYADAFLEELLPVGAATPTARLLVISQDGAEAGTVWLGVNAGKMFLVSVDAGEAVAGSDELFDAILAIAQGEGVRRISAGVLSADRAVRSLIEGRGFTVSSIQMLLEPLPDERETVPDVVVAPMTPGRFPSYAAHAEAAFAVDLVDSGRYTAEEAEAESHRQMLMELPDGLRTEGQSFFTASVGGEEVGTLWIGMRERDGRPHAFVLDIEVAEEHRRRGYGRVLMHAAEREGRALGAESIGLHVFGFNTGAIDLYERLGYRRIEETCVLDL
ncbi:GNAT family N-acetyltransferase [Microbacterium hydrocarbonoxydans]|uniref:GNAT family N-acetyltransferase n=1 Tax=Microbacterium hydrocarbonoxydans TaxID=273678 RepID=UPI0013D94464|nr:GNAT family N-acetyltransferase [Microbacterium hydrocarbonoxydans]